MKNVKLQYYLRGLGIGIIVTAVILGLTKGDKETLTDAQIRARAVELGMVDTNSLMLSDLQVSGSNASGQVSSENTPKEGEAKEPETQTPDEGMTAEPETGVQAPDESDEGELSTEQKAGTTDGEEPTNHPNESVENGETVSDENLSESELQDGSDADVVTFVIHSGDGSYTISKDLEAAGLIENAEDFDTYLCSIGYSVFIRDGTYEIAVGTSEEEIAEIITRKR